MDRIQPRRILSDKPQSLEYPLWLPNRQNLGYGVVSYPYTGSPQPAQYSYTLGTQSAITVLNDFAGSRSNLWWIAADGVLWIMTMQNFDNFPSATPTITESNTLKQFAVPVPWDEIVNVNKSYYYVYKTVTGHVMWTGTEVPLVAAGASTTYFPQATYNNTTVPSGIASATISITANTAADGSGTDLSASFSGVISAADAIGCILTVTNNHGSLSGYTILASSLVSNNFLSGA